MKRTVGHVAGAVVLLAASGCIAVSSRNNRFGPECEAVEVDGRVYVINTSTGDVGEIDLSRARPFRHTPEDDPCTSD